MILKYFTEFAFLFSTTKISYQTVFSGWKLMPNFTESLEKNALRWSEKLDMSMKKTKRIFEIILC